MTTDILQSKSILCFITCTCIHVK